MTDAEYQAQIDDLTTAAWLHQAVATDLQGRINRARHTGHMALSNLEGQDTAALLDDIADMLAELEGDR